MCFGPSKAERQAAAESQQQQAQVAEEQRVVAEEAQREEAVTRAKQKQEDISEAISTRVARRGMRGGAGRRSLLTAGGGGFLDRFQ